MKKLHSFIQNFQRRWNDFQIIVWLGKSIKTKLFKNSIEKDIIITTTEVK